MATHDYIAVEVGHFAIAVEERVEWGITVVGGITYDSTRVVDSISSFANERANALSPDAVAKIVERSQSLWFINRRPNLQRCCCQQSARTVYPGGEFGTNF
ncbi:MAG: hypothetical protein V7K81_06345 [Nostoc sp.]|nr:hypothetical protein [Nostoc sp. S13]MDF5737555.1 hypothetical protein [Nostoc sp. S13]